MQLLQRSIQISMKVGTAILLFLYLLSAVYFAWEWYWYKIVGWSFINWHTHLAPYGFLLLVIFTWFWWKARFSNTLLAVTSVTITLLLVESVLLLLPPKHRSDFISQFQYNPQNPYHIWEPKHTYTLSSPGEFSYQQTTNSLGYFGKSWREKKDSGIVRIITLGDSFTEGFGTTTDSSYPACLQQMLGEKYEVLNAGTCGSDPVFNYHDLSHRLVRYQPEWVVQTISSHDLFHDLAIRGGFERYQHDGTIYWHVPLWPYVAHISCIVSVIIQQLGVNESNPLDMGGGRDVRLGIIMRELVARYDSLAYAHNFKVLWVFLPLRNELAGQAYDYDMYSIEEQLSKAKSIQSMDLLSCYQVKLATLNINHTSYYWIKDAHHNAAGYNLMASCIAEQFRVSDRSYSETAK